MGAFDGATREQTTGPTMWPRVAMIPASSCTPGGRLQTVVYIRPAPIPHEFSPTPTNYLYNLQITRTFHYNTRQSRNVCISPLSNFSKVNFHPLPKKMTNVMQNSAAHMGTESVMINKKEPVRQDTTDSGYASPPREMPVKESSLSVRLNDGNEIPQVALGVYKAPNGQETEDAVTAALDAGYRHIDSAARYMNEEACGRAPNAWLKKTGTPREDVFVTAKLWDADHGYEPTFNALNDSLKKFGLDSFDLYLIHSPSDDEEKRVASWRALRWHSASAWFAPSVSQTSARPTSRVCSRTLPSSQPSTRSKSTHSVSVRSLSTSATRTALSSRHTPLWPVATSSKTSALSPSPRSKASPQLRSF